MFFTEMGLRRYLGLILFSPFFLGLFLCVLSGEVSVSFLQTPASITNRNSASFKFRTLASGNGSTCSTTCKLNNNAPSLCGSGEVFYAGLEDGHHTCEVCSIGDSEVGCSSYKWIVDTVAPTAYVAAATSFTSANNVSVNVSFNKPCTGQGGFQCTSVESCNLLVYGAGQVIPTTLNTIQPNLRYSLIVSLASNVQYGRVLLAMGKNFCTDAAGNEFTGTQNSSFIVHFDRRSLLVSLRTRIPERPLQLNGETRTVQATNTYKSLELYLYFSKPVINSTDEIINFIHTSQGSLVPINANGLGNRRFAFRVNNISRSAVVTVGLDSELLASRYGTPVSPMAPVAFIYDSQRPAVKLSTSSTRTSHRSLHALIRFMKPVFGFNSSYLSVTGGYLQGFHEVTASLYSVDIKIEADVVSINVPENKTNDVAGNGNLASNILQVKYYSPPAISKGLSSFATATFLFTALAGGLLTISTASIQSMGAFGGPSSNPTSNLFRMAGHIQIFALSRWLPVTLPVEYYEFAKGIQWSNLYFGLPWDMGDKQQVTVPSSSPTKAHSYSFNLFDMEIFKHRQPKDVYVNKASPKFRLPLSPAECNEFYKTEEEMESLYKSITDEADGWKHFDKCMFWLAVLGGSLILLHALLLLILKFRKTKSEKQKNYGALIFPRFEILLLNFALPIVCEAAAAILKGGSTSGTIVGALMLGAVSFLLVATFSFLLVGITLGKLLHYEELHKEVQKPQPYQELTRVTLGPGKKGEWTWINQCKSAYVTIFGPLFEDLRGPLISKSVAENPRTHNANARMVASDDPFQKLLGTLKVYYTIIETIKRVTLGILAGVNFDKDKPTKAPTIISLIFTLFQLLFLVIQKPFIKKEVQLVEYISVSCEVGIFAICLVLLENEFPPDDQKKIGISMLCLFVLSFVPQIINACYALYRQIKKLDRVKNSFWTGLVVAAVGVLSYFIPEDCMKHTYNSLEVFSKNENADPSSSGSRTSSTNEKPWAKVREYVKSNFSKESSPTTTDPSTSGAKSSELLGNKSTLTSSLSNTQPEADVAET